MVEEVSRQEGAVEEAEDEDEDVFNRDEPVENLNHSAEKASAENFEDLRAGTPFMEMRAYLGTFLFSYFLYQSIPLCIKQILVFSILSFCHQSCID